MLKKANDDFSSSSSQHYFFLLPLFFRLLSLTLHTVKLGSVSITQTVYISSVLCPLHPFICQFIHPSIHPSFHRQSIHSSIHSTILPTISISSITTILYTRQNNSLAFLLYTYSILTFPSLINILFPTYPLSCQIKQSIPSVREQQ